MNRNSHTHNYEVITEEILRPMERGQITLPAKIRKNLGINKRTWLRISELSNKKIVIEPVNVKGESEDPNIIPAKMPFDEMLKELAKLPEPSFKDSDFDYLKKMRKPLTKKEIKERYGW